MITFAYADDWVAVYKDGNLVHQGHSIHDSYLLELLQIPYESKGEYAQDQMDMLGYHFPENLADLPDPV